MLEDTAENFDAVVEQVSTALSGSDVCSEEDTTGWEVIAKIPLREDVV